MPEDIHDNFGQFEGEDNFEGEEPIEVSLDELEEEEDGFEDDELFDDLDNF